MQSLSLGVPKGPFSFAKENGPSDLLPCTVQGKLLPHWCGNRCKLFCEKCFDRPARSGHAALHKIRLAAAAAVQLGIHLFRELTKKMNAELNGRGGGKPNFVQGSVAAARGAIEAFFAE